MRVNKNEEERNGFPNKKGELTTTPLTDYIFTLPSSSGP
jgi:hypothetical protein